MADATATYDSVDADDAGRQRSLAQMASGWRQRIEFWKHLTGLEATVLGLTVGLLSVESVHVSGYLIASWVVLLLGVAVGCLLIHTGIEERDWASLRDYRKFIEMASLARRVAAGEVDESSPEHTWLMGAIIHRSLPVDMQPTFEAGLAGLTKADVEQVKTRLKQDALKSASSVLEFNSPPPIARWLQEHVMTLQNAFYGLAGSAVVLLLVSILTRAR